MVPLLPWVEVMVQSSSVPASRRRWALHSSSTARKVATTSERLRLLEQGAEPGDPGPEQPADDLLPFRHGVWLPPHDALKGRHWGRQLVVRPGQDRQNSLFQVLPVVDIAVGPVRLNGLRHFGDEVSPIAVPPVQQGAISLIFR